MSLIYAQGFDTLGGQGGTAIRNYMLADGWQGATPSIGVGVAPFGGYYLSITRTTGNALNFGYPVNKSSGKFIWGHRMYNASDIEYNHYMTMNFEGIASIRRLDFGRLRLAIGAVVAESAWGVLPSGGYFYFEVKYDIDTGDWEVRVNTETVISVNAPLSIGRTLPAIIFSQGGSTGNNDDWRMDDIYVCDEAGSINNDFLGNVRVRSHVVNGNGDHIGLTPVGSANNWQNVLNPTIQTKTDYNWTSTLDEYDLYTIVSDSVATKVFGIINRASVRQADATQLWTADVIKTGGTEFEGPEKTTNSSFYFYKSIWELNPDTLLDWTASDINSLQIGARLTNAA